jgi:hypothetical protein
MVRYFLWQKATSFEAAYNNVPLHERFARAFVGGDENDATINRRNHKSTTSH